MEQNNDQLENDLNLASKETQRDMYDASNQKLQTLILSSTVMFVSLMTIMIQPQEVLTITCVYTCAYAYTSAFIFGDSDCLRTHIYMQDHYETFPLAHRLMSFFGALSFFFLFASIVMCIELLNRCTHVTHTCTLCILLLAVI